VLVYVVVLEISGFANLNLVGFLEDGELLREIK